MRSALPLCLQRTFLYQIDNDVTGCKEGLGSAALLAKNFWGVNNNENIICNPKRHYHDVNLFMHRTEDNNC